MVVLQLMFAGLLSLDRKLLRLKTFSGLGLVPGFQNMEKQLELKRAGFTPQQKPALSSMSETAGRACQPPPKPAPPVELASEVVPNS